MKIVSYSAVTPFVGRATVLTIEPKKEISTKSIVPPPTYDEGAVERLKQALPKLMDQNLVLPVYQLFPLELYVPQKDSASTMALVWALKETYKTIFVQVTSIDYRAVGFAVNLRSKGKVQKAEYPLPSGVITTNVMTGFYLAKAKDGVTPKSFKGIHHKVLRIPKTKRAAVRKAQDFPTDLSDIQVQFRDKIEITLDAYLDSPTTPIKPLLLSGSTGVAKSAVVKAAASKHGFRLVDLRAAFLDRLDIRGIGKPEVDAEGEWTYTTSPARWAVECCDEFITNAERMVPKLEQRLKGEQDHIKQLVLNQWLEYYQEMSKPPVIFFDEIMRAPGFVRNTLFTILMEKEFEGYKMTRARIVAATNVSTAGEPTDAPNYMQGDGAEDLGFLDRFNVIPVTPADVLDRWKAYGKKVVNGQQNIHQAILDLIEQKPELAYKVPPEGLGDKYILTPFPNYRTWEFVSRMLNRGYCNKEMTAKMVGPEAATALTSILVTKYPKIKLVALTDIDPDKKRASIKTAFDADIPLLLVGPTALGKSTRIREISEAENSVLITIPLSRFDRAETMGFPIAIDTFDEIRNRAASILPSGDPLLDELEEMQKDYKGPRNVTGYAPWGIKQEIAKAIREGRRVTLFFDELNRAPDEVKSAVFEAISDCRFAGIEWCSEGCPCSEVRVISACNYGEQYEAATELDPAFTARFAMDVQDEMTLEDLDSFKKYIKDKKWHQAIVNMFDDVDPQTGLKWMSMVEEASLTQNQPSPRGWNNLSIMLEAYEKQGLMQGYPFPNRAAFESALAQYKGKNLPAIDEVVRIGPKGWLAANDPKAIVVIGGKDYHISVVFKAFKEAYRKKDIERVKTLGGLLGRYDRQSTNARMNMLDQSIGGGLSTVILKYYDDWQKTQAGGETVGPFTADALTSPDLRAIIANVISVQAGWSPAELSEAILRLLVQCNSFNPTPDQAAHFLNLVAEICKENDIVESLLSIIVTACDNDDLYSLISRASTVSDFTSQFYNLLIGADLPKDLADLVTNTETDMAQFSATTGLNLFVRGA